MPQIELHNEDCMRVMAGMPDNFIGCEVSPHYFKLAKQRIEQETRQGDMLQPHLNNTTELEH